MPRTNQHWRNTEDDFRSKVYQCAYCELHVSASKGYWATGDHERIESTIAICPNCATPTYFERHTTQIPRPPFGESVPHINNSDIESIYEEARGCTANGAYTAAVMLCRKLLMNIAVHQGALQNQSFHAYVTYLDENGYVPPNAKKWIDSIRKKGNEANHEIHLMDDKDASRIIRFSEMLLRFIYEIPNICEDEEV